MSRRVLVYGVYPPTPGPEAAATLATVRELLAQGAEVEVVSPWPSAARGHAHVDGMRGSLRLVTEVARLRPGEIVAHLDPALLRPRRPGPREPLARRLLGLALRGATVHLPALAGRLHPAYVALALGRAARVVVATGDDAEALVAAGLPRARVETRPSPPAPPGGGPGMGSAAAPVARAPWPVKEPVTRRALEAEIRRRAAADRGAAGTGDGGATGDPSDAGTPAPGPLGRIIPFGDPPVWSPNPVARLVKALVWRLTRWEVEPLVDQVNLVHRAAAAEIEGQRRADSAE